MDALGSAIEDLVIVFTPTGCLGIKDIDRD
jgi:hypothetical protein